MLWCLFTMLYFMRVLTRKRMGIGLSIYIGSLLLKISASMKTTFQLSRTVIGVRSLLSVSNRIPARVLL